VAEQAVGQRVVETFNDCLVFVNFNAPAANGCFVVSISLVTAPNDLLESLFFHEKMNQICSDCDEKMTVDAEAFALICRSCDRPKRLIDVASEAQVQFYNRDADQR